MSHVFNIGALESFLIAVAVLIMGHMICARFTVLKRFNIPEPIVGGLVVATAITVLHFNGISLVFNLPLQGTFMLIFFATVGLAASYSQLLKGGVKVFLFLGIASLCIVLQNTIGVSLATLLGLDPFMGLLAGSITLSGGHGTGAAWSQTLEQTYGLTNTLEIAMASATFGLIAGGLLGTPIAQRLIEKHKLKPTDENIINKAANKPEISTYYDESEEDKITTHKVIELLFILMICVLGAKSLKGFVDGFEISWLKIPDFVYALFFGVVITNFLEVTKLRKIETETLHVLGTLSLSLFLAMALMSLKLWNIFDLAIPFLIILAVQSLAIVLFCFFVTYKVMGSNYDAAVIAGGHCGFGMGATPTAVMNMGSIVGRFGPSPQAFMVVPIVGAFFIDIANLIILQAYLSFITG